MIETVHLKNFKNHRDTEIELGRLTALVGPNGAGKTSILEAVHQLARVVRKGQLKGAVDLSEARNEFVRWRADRLSVEAQGTIAKERWMLRLSIAADPRSRNSQAKNESLVQLEWGDNQFSVDHTNELFFSISSRPRAVPSRDERSSTLSTLSRSHAKRLEDECSVWTTHNPWKQSCVRALFLHDERAEPISKSQKFHSLPSSIYYGNPDSARWIGST